VPQFASPFRADGSGPFVPSAASDDSATGAGGMLLGHAAASAAGFESSPSPELRSPILSGAEYSHTHSLLSSPATSALSSPSSAYRRARGAHVASAAESDPNSPALENSSRLAGANNNGTHESHSANELTDLLQRSCITSADEQPQAELPRNPFQDKFPHPSLSAQEVLSIQLGACQQNSLPCPDGGIEICFRFASPANRIFTGPVSRFTRMLHSPLYDILLDYDALQLAPANAQGTRWTVTITKGGTQRTFLWTLSKQTTAPYAGCWMTDNVLLLQQ